MTPERRRQLWMLVTETGRFYYKTPSGGASTSAKTMSFVALAAKCVGSASSNGEVRSEWLSVHPPTGAPGLIWRMPRKAARREMWRRRERWGPVLDELVKRGVVVERSKSGQGRGRPATVYTLRG